MLIIIISNTCNTYFDSMIILSYPSIYVPQIILQKNSNKYMQIILMQ